MNQRDYSLHQGDSNELLHSHLQLLREELNLLLHLMKQRRESDAEREGMINHGLSIV